MAININDSLHACAQVDVAAGVPSFSSQQGFAEAIVDNGPGDFTVTFDQPIDAGSAAVSVTPRFATFAGVTYEHPSDATLRVRTWDAAGAALDNVDVSIIVHRFKL